jgi:hypothetical protein
MIEFTEKQWEEGVVFFHGVGKCSVEWHYRDHHIIAILKNEYNTEEDDNMTIKIFFEGKDITDKYLDSMYEVPRIRTTLCNLSRIWMLIDENMDDYIAGQLEMKEGGE